MEKPTAGQLVEEIIKHKGNISAVARAYNRPRSTVYTWINSYETAKQAWADQRELVVDVAENILFKKVAVEEDLQAIFYILNNAKEARARGWGVKHVDVTSDGQRLATPTYIVENRGDADD